MADKRQQAETAEMRFQAALVERNTPDPRDRYRSWLRELKQSDAAAYRRAVQYYEDSLIPSVADDGSDPLDEWLEYGRLVLSMLVDGATMTIDETGLAAPYRRPVSSGHLVLHLPVSSRQPVVAISEPPLPSPAQQATFDLLVLRKVG